MSEMDSRKGLTRRGFVKSAAVGVGVTAIAGLGVKETEAVPISPIPKKWDYEVDVVIVGYGGAGGITAITAHDAGAKVLILEKMTKGEEGGNTGVSAGAIFSPSNVPDAVTYMKALFKDGGGMPTDDIILAWAEKGVENAAWMKKMGAKLIEYGKGKETAEYPTLPGADCMSKWSAESGRAGVEVFEVLSRNVTERGIKVLYESPAKELIQDGNTKEVLGVKANQSGKEIFIKARKAVVLTCGSFEFNEDMKRNYLTFGYPIYGWGTPGNTGDGVKMVQMVGGDLWHMNNPAGPIGLALKVPDFVYPFPLIYRKGYIYIDRLGKRFMNEDRYSAHGKGWMAISHYEYNSAEIIPPGETFGRRETVEGPWYPRIPCYVIIDETSRLAGPLAVGKSQGKGAIGWSAIHGTYNWSADNSVEIAKGWIKKGDTIEDLATKIGVVPATLKETLTTYNGNCELKKDPQFNRDTKKRIPLKTPPFYAIEAYPIMTNNQGGAKHNKDQQVLFADGRPIPRLYAAGEFGSIYGFLYQGAGNLGENISSGRVAGEKAAAEKPWIQTKR